MIGKISPGIIRLDETVSTNDVALQLAAEGAPEFTAVTSLRQSGGRGRCGRPWVSKPGSGLYVSMILRPARMDGITLIPLISGIAVAEAVMETAECNARLKWPNDVLISGRKIAGVLAETVGTAGSSDFAVIVGVGVNLTTDPADLPVRMIFPASSILGETGSAPSSDKLLDAWIAKMRVWFGKWREGRITELCERWCELDLMNGVRVSVAQPDGNIITGIGRGIDTDGALLLESSGGIGRVLAGDARIC